MTYKKIVPKNQFPAFWKFDEKPTLEGVYVANRQGKFGLVYDVQTSDGLVTVSSSRTLDAYMEAITIGSKVKITRAKEKVALRNGHLAWSWEVGVDNDGQATLKAK